MVDVPGRLAGVESAAWSRTLGPIEHIWLMRSLTTTDRYAVMLNLLLQRVRLHESALQHHRSIFQFSFFWLYQSHIQVTWHSSALEYVLFIQREVKIMLHSGRHALIWDETDIFLSQDSSKLKENTYNHTCDHLIVLQSSKVILKHESQHKIINQHGIIDYGNVITIWCSLTRSMDTKSIGNELIWQNDRQKQIFFKAYRAVNTQFRFKQNENLCLCSERCVKEQNNKSFAIKRLEQCYFSLVF